MSDRRAGLPERIRRDARERVTRPLNRRAFLAAGVVAAVGVATVGAQPVGAATGLTVYRLNADWGYPVGPKGKTRCACKACFRRAESAYFTTKAAAIAGRIHPCCVCQPYRTIIAVPSAALFDGASSADIRDPRVAGVLAAVPMGEPTGELPSVPDHGIGGLFGLAAPEPSALDQSVQPQTPMGFARTGSTLRLPIIGVTLAAAGGALIAFRARGIAAQDHNQGEPS